MSEVWLVIKVNNYTTITIITKVNKFYATVFLIMAFASVSAQEKRVLSLEEAVKLGIANSKNLKIDQAKIEESTANLLAAKNR